MIKTVLKHYIWEMCIEILFNKVHINFIGDPSIYIGKYFSIIDNGTTSLLKCKITGIYEVKECKDTYIDFCYTTVRGKIGYTGGFLEELELYD